jgi:hypothetical protein
VRKRVASQTSDRQQQRVVDVAKIGLQPLKRRGTKRRVGVDAAQNECKCERET